MAKKDEKPKKADDKKDKKDDKEKKGKSKEPNKQGSEKEGGSKGVSSSKNLDKSEIPGIDSERTQEIPPLPTQPVCMTHGKNLPLYCTSCEEPVCEACATVGPHNNQVMVI